MKFISSLAGLFNLYVRKTTPLPQIFGMCVVVWTLMFTTMPRLWEPPRAFSHIIWECMTNLSLALLASGFMFFIVCASVHFLVYLEKRDWSK